VGDLEELIAMAEAVKARQGVWNAANADQMVEALQGVHRSLRACVDDDEADPESVLWVIESAADRLDAVIREVTGADDGQD